QIYQIFRDSKGRIWFPNYQGLAVFEGDLKQLNVDVGLPQGPIHFLAEDKDKRIWVGSPRGCSVLAEDRFSPIRDPLLANQPIAQILADPLGNVWFLRGDAQVVQRKPDGRFQLCALPYVAPIDELRLDPEGTPWLIGNGIFFRFTGETWESIEPPDQGSGAVYDFALSYHGTAWFAADSGLLAQGRNETNLFGRAEGLPGDGVRNLFTGRHQTLWMNVFTKSKENEIPSCIARYDGVSFQAFDRKRGLLADEMTGLYEFANNTTWILHRKGVSLIQGDEIREIGVSQGLAGNGPRKVIGDEKGNFWIATNGGFSKVKGSLVTSYSLRDGLPDGDVMDLLLDGASLWVRTRGSICRFTENPAQPGIKIHKVINGDRVISPDSQPSFSASENDLTLYFQGITLNRGADQIQFQYKTQKGQKSWFGPIKDNRIALNNLSSGVYSVQVRAFSRDLYESPKSAVFQFEIQPPFYMKPLFVLTTLLILLGAGYATYQWRLSLSVARAKAQNELHVAHDLQMSLMPTRQPQLENLEICGFCQPAMEVGGDYYDFFWESETQLGIAVIDVSGRSMEAAIIAVMTSGLLYGETANVRDPATILKKINQPLYKKSGKKTFVAGLFASIDRTTRVLRWANAGQCAPLLVRASQVSTLKINTPSLPLGVKPNSDYRAEETVLQPGDLVFLFTDGLTEATNPENELFGLERLKILLGQLNSDAPSEVIQRVLTGLNHFCREQAPLDDITMVALKVQ
ncbi:MAG: SpoIIE family protein phosphatase, partial [Acidobacteria bacterium]|nr:SpoIIE family protein phosphatase [Acidobacteriota bacterium]